MIFSTSSRPAKISWPPPCLAVISISDWLTSKYFRTLSQPIALSTSFQQDGRSVRATLRTIRTFRPHRASSTQREARKALFPDDEPPKKIWYRLDSRT